MTIKQFGEKIEGIAYTLRVGIHLIVFNPTYDKILLVSPPNGSYLLPGGERELNETHVETLKREAMEELGFEIEVGEYLGEADEYYYSSHRKKYYHNPAHFYVAASWNRVGDPLEDFNTLKWTTIPEAVSLLKRGSHRWAVEQLVQK
ncbi:NUDIX hydrolase [Desemzia sp. RIT804]|uniref:NUDIX hydrolase n=1 Tax=Desemzia sp. RIT 804 TaxID=2810209 RepID=UPI001950256C|nr:NUDIX hydrolase [Desemzia sp. RIT 804]MBM6615969.1 NUDIX hydrolase [Desemzia sp. RIT 804]